MKIILKNSNLCFLKNNYRNITNEIHDTFEEYAQGYYLSDIKLISTNGDKRFYYNTIEVIPNEEYILNIDTSAVQGGDAIGYLITSTEDKTSYTKNAVLKSGPRVDLCTDVHIIIPQGAKLMFIQRYSNFNTYYTEMLSETYKVTLYKKN